MKKANLWHFDEMHELLEEVNNIKSSRDWASLGLNAEHIFPTTSKNYFGQDVIIRKKDDQFVALIRTNGGSKDCKKLQHKEPLKLLIKLENWMMANKVNFVEDIFF